jgi:hypothetical protein
MNKKRGRKSKDVAFSKINKQLSLYEDDLFRLDELVEYRARHNKNDGVVMRSGIVRDLIFLAYEEIKC